MKRTWTNVGKGHTEGKEEEIAEMINRLEWKPIPCDMPAGPGLGIKEVIKQCRIPKVSEVAYSHELAPYGLMGVKAHYKNGDANIYMVDEGCNIVIIASDFF